VEERSVAAEAAGVDGMAGIEEHLGAMNGVVLGADVQGRNTGERSVGAVEIKTAGEFTG